MPPEIITRCVFPPVPSRQFDWCSWYEGDEELGEYGWGMTAREAVADLISSYPRGIQCERERQGTRAAPNEIAEAE